MNLEKHYVLQLGFPLLPLRQAAMAVEAEERKPYEKEGFLQKYPTPFYLT